MNQFYIFYNINSDMLDQLINNTKGFIEQNPYWAIAIVVFIIIVLYVILTHEGYITPTDIASKDVEDYTISNDWATTGEVQTFVGGPKFYHKDNFGGKMLQLKSGIYKGPSVGGIGLGKLKSLEIPLGWSVIIYSDANASDSSARPLPPGNYPSLGRSHNGRVKAIKVLMAN